MKGGEIMTQYLEAMHSITKQYFRGKRTSEEAYRGYFDVLRQAATDKSISDAQYRMLVRYTDITPVPYIKDERGC